MFDTADLSRFADPIDPAAVRSKAVSLVSCLSRPSGSGLHPDEAATIHDYVRDNISYVSDPQREEYVAPPAETLQAGGGDCDCQSVLVASMLEAVGGATRIVLCESPNGDQHALPEVALATTESEFQTVGTLLAQYYNSDDLLISPDVADSDGIFWYPVDPVAGEYVGDVEGLKREGLAITLQDGWQWHNAGFVYPE